ncbi:N-acetylmuramoyl-L-alanine amidase [Scopulibacillus darangshiensis]|uniref:Spore cortex-lytic enzyme n=1 Tax=Scopulibacillus darangshiensis TaxID=442528 RepID=A0A4R2PBI0_9BACL|nr:spore cortex-lytic enzyme [Scopulibacillus darangshiensis]TCP31664.1 N-acetylmuramoyl-L-alanine amidase [Scopulibacillus darangshiensis]
MILKRQLYLTGILSLIILGWALFADQPQDQAKAFSPQVIQHGATGDDVIELQARLQYIGFYNGDIDGIFGWGTYWALRNFQNKYGLKVDGLAGTSTKKKLASVSKYNASYVKRNIRQGNDFTYYGGTPLKQQSSGTANQSNGKQAPANNAGGNQNKGKYSKKNLPEGFSQSDLNLIANAVYGESRGEPYVGQVAVAAVILNRIDSNKFPDNVSGVIFQPGAFTAVADGQIWLTPNDKAKQAVMDAINGWDPTHGAIYYFNPDTATSAWIWSRPQIEKIGKHIFCK